MSLEHHTVLQESSQQRKSYVKKKISQQEGVPTSKMNNNFIKINNGAGRVAQLAKSVSAEQ